LALASVLPSALVFVLASALTPFVSVAPNLIESQDLALGDAKIGDLRLQFSDFRVDAFEGCVHDACAHVDRLTGSAPSSGAEMADPGNSETGRAFSNSISRFARLKAFPG
jgi:hypothetical protein